MFDPLVFDARACRRGAGDGRPSPSCSAWRWGAPRGGRDIIVTVTAAAAVRTRCRHAALPPTDGRTAAVAMAGRGRGCGRGVHVIVAAAVAVRVAEEPATRLTAGRGAL